MPKEQSYLKALDAVVDSYFGRQSPMLRAIAAQLADLQELEEYDRRLPDLQPLGTRPVCIGGHECSVAGANHMGRPVIRPFFLRCN